ncbi:MAG: glutamate synthase subunit alpha, partial [Leptolyngbya sp.]|nr:glutamate synthase subunit alpha [Candidatus Melainabacteria bacterium]
HTLAQLGYTSLSQVIGRSDLLKTRDDIQFPKSTSLDLHSLVAHPIPCIEYTHDPTVSSQADLEQLNSYKSIDDNLLERAELQHAITHHGEFAFDGLISNTDRTIGARISGEIAKIHGDNNFAGNIRLNFNGSAGQSFGAFNIQNLHLTLTGESNDYVGKSMSGGEIVVKPFADTKYNTWENVIIGNTCLYGATGGALYVAGQAGERFAIRNSGALAVVEGAGDHCCEYMTGGTAIILGKVGRNFAAGMTGGLAYVYDETNTVPTLFNDDEGKILQRLPLNIATLVLRHIEKHYQLTGSLRAQFIIENWDECSQKFWQVVPPAEAAAIDTIHLQANVNNIR